MTGAGWKRDGGFTLIEATLSVLVLAVGLLGVIYAFQGMTRSSLIADQTVTATNIARGTIDRIIAKRDASGYAAALTAVNSTHSYDENPVTNFPAYVLSSTALEVDPDKDPGMTDDFLDALPNSGYARVTVRVSWNNNANAVQLVTLLADYP